MFGLLLSAHYACTTRYDEAFFPCKTKERKARFARVPHYYHLCFFRCRRKYVLAERQNGHQLARILREFSLWRLGEVASVLRMYEGGMSGEVFFLNKSNGRTKGLNLFSDVLSMFFRTWCIPGILGI